MMTRDLAFELVHAYVEGWKQNDIDKICSVLASSCEIIESHGPCYHGIDQIKQWFKLWLQAHSKVLAWNILAFYYCEEDQTGCFEWDFVCVSHDIRYELSGMSVVKFAVDKISFMHEYRMLKPAYDWRADHLISE